MAYEDVLSVWNQWYNEWRHGFGHATGLENCHRFGVVFAQVPHIQLPEPTHSAMHTLVEMGVLLPDTIPVGIIGMNEAGHSFFAYHQEYLSLPDARAIGVHLPKRSGSFSYQNKYGSVIPGVVPFFDNLVSEGWLGEHQNAALGLEALPNPEAPRHSPRASQFRAQSAAESLQEIHFRFDRLLTFSRECHGNISVIDAYPDPELMVAGWSQITQEALCAKGTLPGSQPKTLGKCEPNGTLRPSQMGELSSHIIKLPVQGDTDNFFLKAEYLCFKATQALLPQQRVAHVALEMIAGEEGEPLQVLAIERFDRIPGTAQKIPFEEFVSLLNKPSSDIFNGSFLDMAKWLRENNYPEQSREELYKTILSQFLTQNSDNHFKNFALFTQNGEATTFTPLYDLCPSAFLYQHRGDLLGSKRGEIGLQIAGKSLKHDELRHKELITLGRHFGLTDQTLLRIFQELAEQLPTMHHTIEQESTPFPDVGNLYREAIQRTWNKAFAPAIEALQSPTINK